MPESPVLLNADPVRLHQVIHNLVHNAAKYTQRGGAIRVLVHVQDERAVLCVEDNGVGISAHVLPRIFNVFSQGDRTLDRAEGGIGLGLSLVKSLVDLHGGSVSAASDGPGCGSRFEVCLPLWKASSESARDEPAANSENRRPSPKRVLIVEDNGFAARMLARVVENAGHAVFVAHSGPEAISIASRERPGFVLMDIGLPGWDGYETARRFRADEDLAHATMVALTGYGREEDRQRAFEAGFDHHLVKPVDIDALLTLLS